MIHAYNLDTQEAEARKFQLQGQHGPLSEKWLKIRKQKEGSGI